MATSETYVTKHLAAEITEIKSSIKASVHPELSIYDKALIYKYSFDGYQELNEKLRKTNGKNTSVYGKLLNEALNKLPNFFGLVYRKINLTRSQQSSYKKALKDSIYRKEPAFISASKNRNIANLLPGNTLFIISSKTGKDIGKIAKFGEESSYNEFEFLFGPNKKFSVLDIEETSVLLTVIMEEI